MIRFFIQYSLLFTQRNRKRPRFLFGTACFFRFACVATAEFCSAADFYARFGGNTRAGYQGGYIVGGKGENKQTTGRRGPADDSADKPALPRFFRLSVPAPPGGAGADCPGSGIQGFIAWFWRRKTVQRVQLVYPAVDKTAVNVPGFFFQFRFDIFDKGIPYALFFHYAPSISITFLCLSPSIDGTPGAKSVRDSAINHAVKSLWQSRVFSHHSFAGCR
jgi:hypothetical protein